MNYPLNIFEPRYIQMVNDALEQDVPIALSQVDPSEEENASKIIIAGFGMPQILQTRPDGSMVIVVKGMGKAQIEEVLSPEPYLTCRATEIVDCDTVSSENEEAMARLRARANQWIKANINDPDQRSMLEAGLLAPQRTLETLAMLLIPDSDLRQVILEMHDVNQRIRLMKFLF